MISPPYSNINQGKITHDPQRTPRQRLGGRLRQGEPAPTILADARDAGLDPPSFLVNVAAVLASAALAAQPEDQRLAASRHIQNALGTGPLPG